MEQILIIGGVAAGPKAACHLKRIKPEVNITLIDQDRLISYGGCGIPYFISGEVPDETALRSTSFEMVRDESFFEGSKGVDVMTGTRVLSIDRQNKTIDMRHQETGKNATMSYDKLVLATGSRPVALPIEGAELEGVFTIGSLRSAIELQKYLKQSDAEKAVIVGGGAIGIEMAEGLEDMWGLETAIVEFMPQLLPNTVERALERMLVHHLRENNVDVFTGEGVVKLESDEKGRVCRVVTSRRTIEAQLVILSAGVRPRDELAREAGLLVSPRGGIIVNERLQTSDPDIYAAGDCIESVNQVSGCKTFAPLGSLANRQGRVVADNLAGIYSSFEGVVGSFIMKAFNVCVGTVGLSLAAARAEGFDADMALIVAGDRAHFLPGHQNMALIMIFDRKNRQVLGVQGFGAMGDAVLARINAAAGLVAKKARIEDFSLLEMAYAPPFSTALDALNVVGNVADNKACGRFRSLSLIDFAEWVTDMDAHPDWLVVDVRAEADAKAETEKYGERWRCLPYPEIRARWQELSRDKHLVLLCGTGTRSYEVQIFLDSVGINNTTVLGGSLIALRMMGFDWLAETPSF